tara:strand:- start:1130 stop:3091 length:1962 start_codon:yes stop_codon:yes gene_type:complete
VSIDADSLANQCELLLSPTGLLAKVIPKFNTREAQTRLCLAIIKALYTQEVLVAEAGTGIGKTYAYLIPGLLSGKKVIISTATKTLQDQLFLIDLPRLIKVLGLKLQVQNLKGRANYLCHHRLELHANQSSEPYVKYLREILWIRAKISQMTYGERTELPEIAEDSGVWPYVTSTIDNCLNRDCAFYNQCFLVKARKRALDADLIIINHHLFMADSNLKETGFGELLPGADMVVFDEAHQLPDIALHFHGERCSTKQISLALGELTEYWPKIDSLFDDLAQYILVLEQHLKALCMVLDSTEDKINWQLLKNNHTFSDKWQHFLTDFTDIMQWITHHLPDNTPQLSRVHERLVAYLTILTEFEQEDKACVRWIECFKHTYVFHQTPFDISHKFKQILDKHACAYVFTSATLTVANSFDYFLKPLGLTNVQTIRLDSPFDYPKQTLLYLPRNLPDTKHQDYYVCLVAQVVPIIKALNGRCFLLFTSHRALKIVASALSMHIENPLLIQGEEAKPILLARFRELGNAVLLGTATFWEGVDMKGSILSGVIIDKLPFTSPNDPLTQGKLAYLKQQNLSGFDELSLPQAILTLKQGVGRLIRDVHDKGILMIADPRLTSRAYGKNVLESLPLMPKTRTEHVVLQFIKEHISPDEIISH